MCLARVNDGDTAPLELGLLAVNHHSRASCCDEIDFFIPIVPVNADCASRRDNGEIDELDRAREILAGQQPAELNYALPAMIPVNRLGIDLVSLNKSLHS
jgi:hypothetical protein